MLAREKDFSRLAGLSSEGRSTATTILSIAIIKALRGAANLNTRAHNLLSFTDNRQDASLQAGHFNDFVQVTLLRSAILRAISSAGEIGISHDEIAQDVEGLSLDISEYASNPNVELAAKRATAEALRDVVGYRVYHDLRRGWRITSPNLEQVGLLKIEYDGLDELCSAEHIWSKLHPVLSGASLLERQNVCRLFFFFFAELSPLRFIIWNPSIRSKSGIAAFNICASLGVLMKMNDCERERI
jgi:hypothetical protein